MTDIMEKMTTTDKLEFAADDFVPQMEESLERGDPVCITVAGESMSPTLRHGRDQVELVSPEVCPFVKNDILFWRRDCGTYALHRLVRIEDGILVINGDAQDWNERIRPDQVIGVVRRFCRDGRWFDGKELRYRCYVSLWTRMRLMRKIIRKLKEGFIHEAVGELKWIYSYGLRYKWAVLWYIFLGIFGTVMGFASGVVGKRIIDAVTGRDATDIIPALLTSVFMQFLGIVSGSCNSFISAKIQIRVEQEIRGDVYDKIMEADWERVSEYHSGDLMNRVNNDVNAVSGSVIDWVPNLITRTFQFVGALAIILYYDRVLAGLALLSAPISVAMSGMVMRRIRKYSRKLREVSSRMMSFHEESFQNIQTIKSFGLTDLYGKKLREEQKICRKVRLDYNKFSNISSAILSLVGLAVSMACYGWGVYRLWGGYITYGTMTLFLQLAGSLKGAFSSLISLVPTAITAATSAGRLMAVTELPKEDRSDDRTAEAFLEEGRKEGFTIRAENIDFSYSTGNKVFSQAEFIAAPNEIVALVGPSGEGKTTMLRILLGIVRVQQGRLWIRSGNKEMTVSPSTRRLFAYVSQDNFMFAGTVAENLRIVKEDATDEELNHVLKLACAYDFVHKIPTGLNSPVKERGGGFSEGQKQRICIARALLADAPILLLDEATSALDVATERKVLRNIMEKEANRTCIVTTHRPSVLSVCSRVYRISGGALDVIDEEEINRLMMDF